MPSAEGCYEPGFATGRSFLIGHLSGLLPAADRPRLAGKTVQPGLGGSQDRGPSPAGRARSTSAEGDPASEEVPHAGQAAAAQHAVYSHGDKDDDPDHERLPSRC